MTHDPETQKIPTSELMIFHSKHLVILPAGWCGSVDQAIFRQAKANIEHAGLAVIGANYSGARVAADRVANYFGIVPRYTGDLGTPAAQSIEPKTVRRVIQEDTAQYIVLVFSPVDVFGFLTSYFDFIGAGERWEIRIMPTAMGVYVNPTTKKLEYFK